MHKDRREYLKRYRLANKNTIAAKQKQYRLANKEKIVADKKQDYFLNRNRILADRKKHYLLNRTKILAQRNLLHLVNKHTHHSLVNRSNITARQKILKRARIVNHKKRAREYLHNKAKWELAHPNDTAQDMYYKAIKNNNNDC